MYFIVKHTNNTNANTTNNNEAMNLRSNEKGTTIS